MIIYESLVNPELHRNWRWGEGTINQEGDFYFGDRYDAASIFTCPEELMRSHGIDKVRERVVDPDLIMDIGL